VGETLRAVLADLARIDPDWLAQQISAEWLERYVHRVENYRLPKPESQRRALAEQIGADGLALLRALEHAGTPAQLQTLESVQVLRQVWQQYYEVVKGEARWRAGPHVGEDEGVIRSPYDPKVRSGKKRESVWLGYKVHLTETCQTPAVEAEQGQESRAAPQLLVQVQTTLADVQDVEVTASIQQALAQAELLPDEQVVDTGYVDADLLVSSQRDYGIRRLRPVLADTSGPRQSRQGLRPEPFSGGLAAARGDLSAGPAQCLLVGAVRTHRSGVCAAHLCGLCLSARRHARHQRWPGGASASASSL